MTKTFFTVADDFDGIINLAGHPVAYGPGDMIVIDSDGDEERAIRDTSPGNDGPLTNTSKRGEAIDTLATDGPLSYGGDLSDGNTGIIGLSVWSFPLPLPAITEGEVARIKPGFAGRVLSFSALSVQDATTGGKAASLSLEISGEDTSDEIVTVTVTGTSPFRLTLDDTDGEEQVTADIAGDALVATVQTEVDDTWGEDQFVVGGSAGAYTITPVVGGDYADTDLSWGFERDEVVDVAVDGTGGGFTVVIGGGTPSDSIPANSTAAAADAIVEAMTEVGTGNVVTSRTGSADAYTYRFQFTGGKANTNIGTMTTPDTLTGGAGTAVPTVIQQGATGVSIATTVAGGSARIVGSSGNPATLDLTSANVTDGSIVAGETIATGSNAKHGNFGADDVIVLSASDITAFIEGYCLLSVNLWVPT